MIEVNSFIHPEEKKAWNMITKAPWLKAFLSKAGTLEAQIALKINLLGNAVSADDKSEPQLYKCIDKAREVFGLKQRPRVFIIHKAIFETTLYYDETPLVIIPDYLLELFDEKMLCFEMGRCIAKLKKDHCQTELLLTNSLDILSMIPIAGAAAGALVCNWLRKAELTADRGGMLVCGNTWDAQRTLLRNAGMPVNYLKREILPDYVKGIGDINKLSGAAQGIMQITSPKPLKNDRVIELFNWVSSGEYADILEENE